MPIKTDRSVIFSGLRLITRYEPERMPQGHPADEIPYGSAREHERRNQR